MRDHNNLDVFHKSHALAVRIHVLVAEISSRRYPGLPQQLRRAAASVAANIVEGCGHSSQREFARFLQLSVASAAEVDYHLKFAIDVKALTHEQEIELRGANAEVRRMLASLLKRVRDDLTDDDDDDSVAAMQRRRRPRSPKGDTAAALVPTTENESHH